MKVFKKIGKDTWMSYDPINDAPEKGDPVWKLMIWIMAIWVIAWIIFLIFE